MEYKGVPVDVKKTIIMSDMPIMPPDMSIELEEEESELEGIDMPPMSILAVIWWSCLLVSLCVGKGPVVDNGSREKWCDGRRRLTPKALMLTAKNA